MEIKPATETVPCATCDAPFERRNYGFKPKNCPACRPGRKPAAKAESLSLGGMTADQLQAILTALSAQNRDMVMEFAEKLRQPDEETLERKETEKAHREAARQARLREVKIEEEAKANRVAACAANQHRKENGYTAISGQPITGTGMFQPMCLRCGYLFPLVSATSELAEGVTARSTWKFGEGNLTVQ